VDWREDFSVALSLLSSLSFLYSLSLRIYECLTGGSSRTVGSCQLIGSASENLGMLFQAFAEGSLVIALDGSVPFEELKKGWSVSILGDPCRGLHDAPLLKLTVAQRCIGKHT
jgi:hypothetical protein